MSTALQTTPHQPTSLTTSPLASSSTSGLQYMSSPYRETYHANQQTASARPSSSSKQASRSRGGSDVVNASSVATLPSQHQSLPDREMTSRVAAANQAPVATASPEYQSHAQDRRRNMPPAAPPRTSSSQNASSAPETSRRSAAAPSERSTASWRPARQSDAPRAPRNGNVEDLAADEARASSSGRRKHQQMAQDPPPRASSSREGRTGGVATVPSRSGAPAQYGEEDAALSDAAAPPPVVATGDYGDQSRRGGRSRHDHRTNKRDKDTKFGDYILGNAIGEGEFGKVRLGWKHHDRVQVCVLWAASTRRLCHPLSLILPPTSRTGAL